jgi:hypothetical protein
VAGRAEDITAGRAGGSSRSVLGASELDLMAKITGFRSCERWAGWDQAPFTPDSRSHVSVFEKLP